MADPTKLRGEGLQWSIAILCVGVINHFADSIGKVSFTLVGERLTRRLRLLSLQKLLQKEVRTATLGAC